MHSKNIVAHKTRRQGNVVKEVFCTIAIHGFSQVYFIK